MDDLGVRGKVAQAAGHSVVEAHADSYQQVAFADGHVVPVHAVHTGHAQAQGVRAGKTADAQKGGDDGNVPFLGQLPKLLVGLGDDHPVAGEDQRLLRLVDQFRRPVDVLPVRLGHGPVAPHLQFLGVDELRLLLEDIAGDIDEHWPRPPCAGDVERLANDSRQVRRVQSEVVVLCDGQGDAGDICFLEAVAADESSHHLAGEGHDGYGVQPGVGDPGHQVGGPGPGGRAAYAYLARGPGIAVGGVGGHLLVAYQDVL